MCLPNNARCGADGYQQVEADAVRNEHPALRLPVVLHGGSMHMGADAVSRLMMIGETPRYLSADDLEWDKGPVSEEELLVAKELDAERRRRVLRSDSPDEQDEGESKGHGHHEGTGRHGVARQSEVRTDQLQYLQRVRQSRNEGPQVREAPGWYSFEGNKESPSEEALVKMRMCGYIRLRVVESTLPVSGYPASTIGHERSWRTG